MSDFEINAFDGYHATIVQVGDKHSIQVEIRGDGEAVGAYELTSYPDEKSGEAERCFYLVEALCRYLNAGGTFSQLAMLLQMIHSQTDGKMEIKFPPPWKLFSVLQEVTEPTIILVNEKEQLAQVVRESEGAETMSMHDLNAQIGEWGA